MTGFAARPRSGENDNAKSERLIAEVDRLLSRMARASRDGREDFLAVESDSRDIGALALIDLAGLVLRDLPPLAVTTLPSSDVADLNAIRNTARPTTAPSRATA